MKHAIIGYKGEVGRCVYEFFKGEDRIGVELNEDFKIDKVDFMHVCINYTMDFVTEVKRYEQIFMPECIIIYTTVIPGTTEACGPKAVHSPIEGRHPNLLEYFKKFRRMIAGENFDMAYDLFMERGILVYVYSDPKITELGKLFSTTRYGINLMIADMEKKVCDELNLDYHEVVSLYQKFYNELYRGNGEDKFVQSTLTPPNGKIGGHCITNNARLLSVVCDDPMVERLATYNKGVKDA